MILTVERGDKLRGYVSTRVDGTAGSSEGSGEV